MMFARRIQRLEQRHRIVERELRPLQDPCKQLQVLMNYDTPVTCRMLGRWLDLLKKAEGLGALGEFLPMHEHDEMVALCAGLTERMHAAHAATEDRCGPVVLSFILPPGLMASTHARTDPTGVLP